MKRNEFLSEYRKQNQLTQHALAEEIGINTGVLSRIERNIGNQNVRRILSWCQSKNISPEKVFPPDAAA